MASRVSIPLTCRRCTNPAPSALRQRLLPVGDWIPFASMCESLDRLEQPKLLPSHGYMPERGSSPQRPELDRNRGSTSVVIIGPLIAACWGGEEDVAESQCIGQHARFS